MHIAVVGRGLIGSAAARHLASDGHRVTLIGPAEPLGDKARHKGIFGSHYDEGRITRKLDAHPFWSAVSRASIDRYTDIEAASGIRFFDPVGALIAGPGAGDFIRRVAAVREAAGIASEALGPEDLARRFPYFRFAPDVEAFHETSGAGHISPRRLVAAQVACALDLGATVLDRIVTGIEAVRGGGARVLTAEDTITADRVIVAAGGYTDALMNSALEIAVYARTVTYFEIDAREQSRLAGMPSVVTMQADGRDPYLLPPIRYPDGRSYLKLGGDPVNQELCGAAEISDWFRSGGSPEVETYLHDHILGKLPGLRIARVHSAACVTSFSTMDLPIIRELEPGIIVATAGCGRGAKCSDELGRLAGLCALGEPDPVAGVLARPDAALSALP